EPSYNQNYDDNYYPHESPSFPCSDNCEESHETFQCQQMAQNIVFSGSDQIQTLQYPDDNPPSPEISNEENFQAKGDLMTSIQTKLLKDLKELAKYDQSTSTDRPIFLNDDEDHPVQNKESPENSLEENVVSKTNQEPPQDSNMHQLIDECCEEVPEEQKQKMEKTMLDLVKICHHKHFLCIHDDEQEVKNVVEQSAERGNRSIQSFKCEVTLEDEIECDMPAKDVCSSVLMTFSNPLFDYDDDLDSSDDESLPDDDVLAEEFKIYSNPLCDEDEINSDKLDPHCFNIESDFVESLLNRDTFIDFSSKFDFSGELTHIKPEIPKSDFDFKEEIHLIENLLYDNSFLRPPEELNAKIADTIIESIPLPILVQDGNSQQEDIDIVTETDDVLLPSDENDDDLSNDSLLGEADLFLFYNSIPSGIENVDPKGNIRFLEELLIDDSILSHELSDANFEDNPLISRPPSEPPDVESFFDLKPDVIAEEISDKLNEDKCFKPGREIFVSTNNEDVDYFPFMFVIRIFLPYLILPEISLLLLSAKSEDTIFDPGLSLEIEVILCRIYVRFPRFSYPFIDFSLGRSISF
nr:hypothetical protein [Tanacetum cinerariifolium]